MPKRIGISSLNGATIDILNTIRANASFAYQDQVPAVLNEKMIPTVGDVLYGNPTLANEFIYNLVTRIAATRVRGAVFNNRFSALKKGELQYGETVEEVFVGLTRVREFSVEKAPAREFARTIPDVKTAFHAINWRVQYPVTIQFEDLKTAFLSIEGVQDLVAKIVSQVYTSAEYDEYLLFKYLMIKAIAHGKAYPISIGAGTGSDLKQAGVEFRGASNLFTFMGNRYNAAGITTTTPKEDQYIFMDAMFNAQYDVDVLSAAFNMDRAEYQGRLQLIDDWTTFDNERFNEIRQNTNMIEEVTAEELALMADVKAVLVDKEWFQIYDVMNRFTEKFVAAGEYWNYFYNVKKIVSSSPFSNFVVFVAGALPETLTSVTAAVVDKVTNESATMFALRVSSDDPMIGQGNVQFVQTEDAVKNGVGVRPYGMYLFPTGADPVTPTISIDGKLYTATTTLSPSTAQGVVFNFAEAEAAASYPAGGDGDHTEITG